LTKFFEGLGPDSMNSQLDFIGDLDHDMDPETLKDFLMKFLEGWGVARQRFELFILLLVSCGIKSSCNTHRAPAI